ncbi:ATP-binding protein [Baileyella intestinalis]
MRPSILIIDEIGYYSLDRLLHHAHIINIRGNSYRMKDRLRVGEFDRR